MEPLTVRPANAQPGRASRPCMERGRRRHPRSSQRSACCPAMPPLSTPCRPGWRACSPTLPLRASPSARCRYLHRAWRQALVPRLAPARDAATRMRASSPAPQCAGPSPAAYAHCAPAPAWTQNNSVQCLVGVHVKARRMQRASLPCLRAVYGLSTARRCACSGWLFLRDNGPVLRYGMGSAQVLELARLMEYQGMASAAVLAPPAPPAPRWAQHGRTPDDAAALDPAGATHDSAAAGTHPVRPGRLAVLLHTGWRVCERCCTPS